MLPVNTSNEKDHLKYCYFFDITIFRTFSFPYQAENKQSNWNAVKKQASFIVMPNFDAKHIGIYKQIILNYLAVSSQTLRPIAN